MPNLIRRICAHDCARSLLIGRIEWTDRHPRLMLACALIAALVALALDPAGPQ